MYDYLQIYEYYKAKDNLRLPNLNQIKIYWIYVLYHSRFENNTPHDSGKQNRVTEI